MAAERRAIFGMMGGVGGMWRDTDALFRQTGIGLKTALAVGEFRRVPARAIKMRGCRPLNIHP